MGDINTIFEGRALVRTLGQVMIGGKTLVSDLTRTFIKFKLLHSYPIVNKNGMTFTPANIAKSIATAVNQPLNLDHQLEGNPGTGDEDKIVGSMIQARTEAKEDSPLLPDSPFSAEIIGVLWNRSDNARRIINSIGDEEREYKVSTEAIREAGSDGWYVERDGEMQFVSSISADELAQWENKEFDKVALAVGGDGSKGATNLWGGAFTFTPADDNAVIEDIITASFDGECVIATAQNPAAPSSVQNKENNMKWKKFLAAIVAGFTADVSGNDLNLKVGDKSYSNPDFYMYGYENGDGSYSVSASLTVKEAGNNGMEETRRFEYDGSSDSDDMNQVEASEAKVKLPSELIASIKALETANAETASKYKNYVSPEAAKTMVDDAVAAAIVANKGDNVDGDKITKKEADVLVADALSARDTRDATIASRCKQIEAAGHALTNERKTLVGSFEVDDEGDAKFGAYLESLKTGLAGMTASLTDANVDITPGIKASLAMIDSKEATAFGALIAGVTNESPTAFALSAANSASGGDDLANFKL